ncbi:MAG: T9SS type A sorting domain-containing protein [Flavobacteriales bacterium]|nr:T9SS type A sorting domain-containing protein [Flavobacteriales bacterium]
MNKLYASVLAIAVGTAAYFLMGNCCESEYQPRTVQTEQAASDGIEGYYEYLNMLKQNPETGYVSGEDVALAIKSVERASKQLNKASFPLQWQNVGPDNIGGRTRGLLVDRNDNNVLYAAMVSGGLFKSTNKGASWYPVDDQMLNLNTNSICQTVNGNIYVGTGENFASSAGWEFGTPGFPGNGIYISQDGGQSLSHLPTTAAFTYVNRLAAHPTQNWVFAATNVGLRYTDDEGKTWKSLRPGFCSEVIIDKNGNIFTIIANRVFRSTDPTNESSYTEVSGVGVGSRAVLAVAESDPNYVYAVVTGTITIAAPTGNITVGSGLRGIYQSKDNGVTFDQIVGQGNTYFSPFTHLDLGSSQGTYDLCAAVHPQNPERLFIGGIEWAEWTPQLGPRIVGNTFDHPSNPIGIHPDKHCITFDTKSNPIIMYIGHDGGITKSTNAALDRYATINNGFQTTQFYGIAADQNGAVLGGTQDNRTIYINGKGSNPESGVFVSSGDGFKCEISELNSDVLFFQSQYGGLLRSLNAGGSGGRMWDSRINASFFDPDDPDNASDRVQANRIFNTPIRLWENTETGENRLFFALDNEVWMANDAVNAPNPIWYRVAQTGFSPHVFEVTPDGNTLFVASANTNILRIDGLNKPVWDTIGQLKTADKISDSLSFTVINNGIPGGRNITDIEVDVNNPDRVIVTLGNYTSANHVYMSQNALSDNVTWTSIDGALPGIPVYDAEISWENPAHIILGTEFGIWSTQNGTAATPTWTENNDGFPRVPVFEMRQQETRRETWRTGPTLYAGTHGRGIFKTANLLTSVRTPEKAAIIAVKAYPNPTSDDLNLSIPVLKPDQLTIDVVNLQGQTLIRKEVNATASQNFQLKLDVANLSAGTYFVSIRGKHHEASTRFVRSN